MQTYLAIQLIPHKLGGALIHQRAVDGYVNATAMCTAAGKKFNDYSRLASSEEFLAELATVAGIPATGLIVTIKGGLSEAQGTWVHPDVAINLGQWCSPKFAVAVAQWVHDWFTGKLKPQALPYHIRRYLANRSAIPPLHFSILNEMIFAVIGPLEVAGYTLPEEMVPDISLGKMFCKWLREEKGIDTNALPTYEHRYEDGRVVLAKAYPNSVLPDMREHIQTVWIPKKAESYFSQRDPNALPFLPKLLSAPDHKKQETDVGKSKIELMKQAVLNAKDNMKLPQK